LERKAFDALIFGPREEEKVIVRTMYRVDKLLVCIGDLEDPLGLTDIKEAKGLIERARD